MITVDELISKGDWRKDYHNMVKGKELVTLHSKSDIAQIARYLQEDAGIPYQETVARLQEENRKLKAEIEQFCQGVMEISVDSFNRSNTSLEEIQGA